MIFYTLLYTYPKSDKINIVLTAIILYLIQYGMLSSIPNINILFNESVLLLSVLIFIIDIWLIKQYPEQKLTKKKKAKKTVRIRTDKNKYHYYSKQYPQQQYPQQQYVPQVGVPQQDKDIMSETPDVIHKDRKPKFNYSSNIDSESEEDSVMISDTSSDMSNSEEDY